MKRYQLINLLGAFLVLAVLNGCTVISVAGTWTALLDNGNDPAIPASLTLIQEGSNITGTAILFIIPARITGSIQGSSVTLTLTYEDPSDGTPITMEIQAKITGSSMSGTYQVTRPDVSGSESGTVTATRE